MNLLQRSIARATRQTTVEVGQKVSVPVELAVAHDGSGPKVIEAFEKLGAKTVFDPTRVVWSLDHFLPAPTSTAREAHLLMLEFCRRHGVKLYQRGEGVIHQVIAETLRPSRGAVVAGADGHMATVGAWGALGFSVSPAEMAWILATGHLTLEVPPVVRCLIEGQPGPGVGAKDMALHLLKNFGTDTLKGKALAVGGSAVKALSWSERMTLTNMMGELGAVTGWIDEGEDTTSGGFEETIELDASSMSPVVACPPSPANVRDLAEVSGVPLTQVVVGGCSAGRLEDMQVLAEVLSGRRVHPGVNLVVVPASARVLGAMEREGYTAVIRASGGIITPPGCGPCGGNHLGVAGSTDSVLTTTVRNTPGRMGARQAAIYIASPYIAAWSAVHRCLMLPNA